MERRREPVFIGPICVGKTTVSRLVAERLGMARVELDEVAMPYYRASPEFLPEEFNRLQAAEGFIASYRYFEAALAFAVERVVADHAGSLLDLGAGHTCYLDERYFSRVEKALSSYDHIVLLLPHRDPERAVQTIRDRCRADRQMSWEFPEVDFLAHWVRSDQNRRLAKHVVYTHERTPDDVASLVLNLLT